MKRNILFIVIGLFVWVAYAQDSFYNYTPEQRANIQNAWMIENLGLDSTQYAQVSRLNLEYALKMEELKSMNGKARKLKTIKMLSEEKDEKLELIFTAEQFKTFTARKEEMREKAREMYKENN